MNILPSGSSYTFTLPANNQLTVTSRGGATVTGPSGLLGTVDGTSTFGAYSTDTVITVAAVGQDCSYGVIEPSNVRAVTGPNGEVSLKAGGVNLGGTPRQCLLVDSLGTLVPGSAYIKASMDKVVIDTDNAAVLANKSIKVPSWANFVKVTAHLSFPDQNVAAGHASVHLWRKSDPTKYTAAGLAFVAAGYDFQLNGTNSDSPTPEAHYHNRVYYPQLATSSYISVLSVTGWLPVIATDEEWTAYAWQDSGSNVTLPNTGGVESWLLAEFK